MEGSLDCTSSEPTCRQSNDSIDIRRAKGYSTVREKKLTTLGRNSKAETVKGPSHPDAKRDGHINIYIKEKKNGENPLFCFTLDGYQSALQPIE